MDRDQIIRLLAVLLVGFCMVFFSHRLLKQWSHTPPLPDPPLVRVQKPTKTKLAQYVTQTGTVVAYHAVNLVARVEGYLQAIEFTDGSFVKKGKELFIIEPAPYLEKLKSAQASVVVHKASHTYANAEYQRQKRMYTQNATSLNNVEKWAARDAETSAEIDKAVADATVAAINYSYTHVLAPFDGRIGRHLVDIGNLVGNGVATDLATLEQIHPIYVYFNLNELDVIKIRNAARAQSFDPAKIDQVPVEVAMQNETGFPHKGNLNFFNTGLNASTGTLEFRAILPNADYTLLPGFFVQVRIPLNNPTMQLTIPDTAVQYDQIGPYVFVIDTHHLVVLKRITLGALEQGMRAVVKGLLETDDVIVAGLQNAIPHHRVTPLPAGKQP